MLDATTGEPIVAAKITVQTEIPGSKASTSTVDTDSAGRFQIDSPFVQYGSNYIWASKPGYTWKDRSVGDPRHIVFRLLALSTIMGVVMDASGKPVSGAHIATTVVPWEKAPPQSLVELESKPITDPEGRFQVPVVPTSYLVCAFPPAGEPGQKRIAIPACFPSAPDYSAARVVTVTPGRTTEQLIIHLSEVPVYSIRGRIRFSAVYRSKDWGMEISASSADYRDRPGCQDIFGPQSTLCSGPYFGEVNKDGRFVISGIPSGSYTLFARAGDGVGHEIVATDYVGGVPPKQRPVHTGQRDLIVTRNLSGIDVNIVLRPD